MFTGQNIIEGLPDDLTKVVTFLNEKASTGEFVFCDSFSEWEKAEDITRPLGSKIDMGGYYLATGLAYLANIANGKLVIPAETSIWRWAWSLQVLAGVAGWPPSLMKNMMESFSGKKDNIDSLINRAAQNYGRADFSNGLELLEMRPQNRVAILAGLMEKDFDRYCGIFPPKANPDEFATVFVLTSSLNNFQVNKAFDIAVTFLPFSSVDAMAFFLSVLDRLDGSRKEKCKGIIAGLLKGDTSQYEPPLCNWLYMLRDASPFAEECILAFIKGLDEANKKAALSRLDESIGLHFKDPKFLTKVFTCVAENLQPTDVLLMESCLRNLHEKGDYFKNLVLSLVMHPKGMYRIVGRRLWDEYHLESSDFDASKDLQEELQCIFIISMLQDYGNPETRLPKLLPLIDSKSERVRNILMGRLGPYLDDYMGHVINILDKLKLDNKYVKIIKQYYEQRADALEKRRNLKELSPRYNHMLEYQETMRLQKVHMQEKMREAEKEHKSFWKDMMKKVALARGGGWRDEDGAVHHLAHFKYSMPSRQLQQSMSPMEQEDWLNELLKDWDGKAGSN